jgi:hypothetical protein
MNRNLLSSLLFVGISWCSFSQIVTKSTPSKTTAAAKVKSIKDTNSRFYLEAGYFSCSPKLSSNTDFLNKPLGERANETKLSVWSYSIGLTTPISNLLYFDGGLSLLRNGEQYKWTSTTSDSTFNYQSRYNYIAMPLQLKLQGGNNFRYFVGGGLIPELYQSYSQKQQWNDSLGSSKKAVVKVNSDMNSFALSWVVTAGVELIFKNNFGLRLSGSYRSQVTNSYKKYSDYVHKTNAIGFNIALTRKF